MKEDAPQRDHSLRELFNGLRWMIRAGGPWRLMPHDLPPWHTIHQQAMRWMKSGRLEAMAHDLRGLVRLALGKQEAPTAAIYDSRTLQSAEKRVSSQR
jgi:transposase